MTADSTPSPEDSIRAMHQTTLDLVVILENHAAHEAREVMSGLMRFERGLREAVETMMEQIRGPAKAEAVFETMNAPLDLAMRFGAGDLVEVSQRAFASFEDLLEDDADLKGKAAADAIVWTNVARETRVAVLMLFHASLFNGRAPNGKPLSLPG